jgi:hypothetical protein
MLLHKNLQAACGPRPRITKEGVSIDVLRLCHRGLASRAASQATVFHPAPTAATMPPPPHMSAVATRNTGFFLKLDQRNGRGVRVVRVQWYQTQSL